MAPNFARSVRQPPFPTTNSMPTARIGAVTRDDLALLLTPGPPLNCRSRGASIPAGRTKCRFRLSNHVEPFDVDDDTADEPSFLHVVQMVVQASSRYAAVPKGTAVASFVSRNDATITGCDLVADIDEEPTQQFAKRRGTLPAAVQVTAERGQRLLTTARERTPGWTPVRFAPTVRTTRRSSTTRWDTELRMTNVSRGFSRTPVTTCGSCLRLRLSAPRVVTTRTVRVGVTTARSGPTSPAESVTATPLTSFSRARRCPTRRGRTGPSGISRDLHLTDRESTGLRNVRGVHPFASERFSHHSRRSRSHWFRRTDRELHHPNCLRPYERLPTRRANHQDVSISPEHFEPSHDARPKQREGRPQRSARRRRSTGQHSGRRRR